MACGYPCTWVKEHFNERFEYTSKLLIVDNGENLQCIQDGISYDIDAIVPKETDVSHAPCEWIRRYWNIHGVMPSDYPCEWIRLYWNV